MGERALLEENRSLRREIDELRKALAERSPVPEDDFAHRVLRVEHALHFTLAQTSSLTEALNACLFAAIEASGMDCGGLYLVRDGGCDLLVHHGISSTSARAIAHFEAGSANMRLVNAGKPVYTEFSDALFAPQVRRDVEPLRAVALIPIYSMGRAIACLNLASHTLHEVPEDAKEAIEWIASRAGTAIARVQAEEARRTSEEAFRALTDGLTDVIMRFDREMRLLYVNPAIEQQTGKPPSDFLGKTLEELGFPPSLHALWQEAAQAVITTCENRRIEFHLPGGTWVDALIIPEFGAGQEVSAIIVSARGITAQKRVEQELRESKNNLRTIGDSLLDALILINGDGKVEYWNPAAETIFGYTSEEIMGKDVHQYIMPECYAPDFRRGFGQFQATGTGAAIGRVLTLVGKRKNGQEFPVEIALSVLHTAGQFRATATIRDITARRQREQEILLQQQRYRNLFENANDGIIYVDKRGTILEANSRCGEIFGLAPEEMIGRHIRILLEYSNLDIGDIARIFKQVFSSRKPLREFELECHHRTGYTIWADMSARIIREQGRLCGVLVNIRDVSDKKKVLDALAESERMFRNVVESSPMGIHQYSLESSGRLVFVGANPVADRILGIQHAALVGLTIEEAFPALVETPVPERYREVARNAGVWRVPHVSYQDGVVRGAFEVCVFQTAPCKIAAMFQDITTRLQAEAQLRESEARYRFLVQHSSDVIITLDEQGIVRFISPSIERIAGYTVPELAGVSAFTNVHPSDLPGILELFAKHVNIDDAHVRTEYRYQHKNGKWLHFEGDAVNLLKNPSVRGILLNVRDVTERRQALEQLAASESKLRALFRGAPIGISFAIDRMIMDANETFCRIVGYSREELLGKTTRIFYFSQEEYEAAGQGLYAPSPPGERSSTEARFRRKNGEAVYILLSASMLRADNPAEGFVVTGLDITARKQAEEQLKASESTLRSVFRAAPMGIAFAINRVMLDVNESLCELTGYDARELLGQDARMLYFSQKEYEEAERGMYSPLAQKERGMVESRFRRKDGHAVDVILSASMLYAGNPAAGFVVTALDITARKQTEERLRTNESMLRSVFRAAPLGITFTRNRKFLSVNETMCTMMGYTEEELLGADTRRFYETDQQYDEVGRALFTLIPEKGSGHVETWHLRKDGSTIHVSLDAALLRQENPSAGFVVTVQDITERKQAEKERAQLEEQLQQAMKMEAVGRLAGGVAHDFNNLLTTILGNIELARADLAAAAPIDEHLDEVRKAAESAASLTRQLLAFSRKQIIEPRVVDLNHLVDNLRKMLERLIGEHIVLDIVLEKDLVAVRVDPGQFEQVLVNLVVNARDAMPNGGRMRIETAHVEPDEAFHTRHPDLRKGPFVLLAVSDSGQGMPEEIQAHIFEPFFTTKPLGHGTGLGLAMIFGIVKQAGGSIEVHSEIDRGTTFSIYLPKIEERITTPNKESSSGILPSGSECVLLVEDEDSVRGVAQKLLEWLGYTVICAASGEEALELARHHEGHIDLLMTDMVMPGINGRELAEQMSIVYPRMKVLYTSGYTDDPGVRRGVFEEHLNFIAKPYPMAALAHKIRESLDAEGS